MVRVRIGIRLRVFARIRVKVYVTNINKSHNRSSKTIRNYEINLYIYQR